MAKDMIEDSEVPVEEDDTPTVETSDPQSICAKKFLGYKEDPLAADRESAAGATTIACLGYEENQNKVRLKLCRLEDAHAVRGEYGYLRNCISTTLAAHAAGAKAHVETFGKNEEELTKKLAAVMDELKKVKEQLAVVNTLACKLETVCNDSCTAEERRILDKALGKNKFKLSANEIIKKVKGEKDANGLIVVKGVAHRADDLFDMGVKYAGIQASANVASLKPWSLSLDEMAIALATNVTEQIEKLDASLTSCQKDVDEGVALLSGSLYERHTTSVTNAALEALDVQLKDLADTDCESLNYEDSVTTLIANCDEAVTTFDVTSACLPAGDDNKFNTKLAPSC